LLNTLFNASDIQADPIAREVARVLTAPTGKTSAGYPFLEKDTWDRFRDRVPHLLGMGQRTWSTTATLLEKVEASEISEDVKENARQAARVIRQIVFTACITAPTDLWLLRHVLGFLKELGLVDRLLSGEAIYPEDCHVKRGGNTYALDAVELDKDLRLLLSRGMVEEYANAFRMAGHPRVQRLLEEVESLPEHFPSNLTQPWRVLFAGESLDTAESEILLDLATSMQPRTNAHQNHWIPTLEEMELGFRLIPVVLGLRANEMNMDLKEGVRVGASDWSTKHPKCAAGALEILTAAGWMVRSGEIHEVTALGARGFSRGPGPFGIIETYHPYMGKGVEILLEGSQNVWVARGENVGASQDANRRTFEKANDALDRYCDTTGFQFGVFIEHAIGRGEATRQRFVRNGEATIQYFGADLEDAAIDAAIAEKEKGNLPQNMVFVRQADIGDPEALFAALRENDVPARGAVMLVGNGFHEVREQTDKGMVDIFRRYHDAGILLLFTEENALSIEDLRATAWNTYHAGFKYVHEKSGQGLRPAHPRPPVRLGSPLRAAWSACAQEAGYLRADAYCSKTRTIYPYPPPDGFNPSISVNHFFVPSDLARDKES
jgi:hypothetical protein